jgi:hypothetical protein
MDILQLLFSPLLMLLLLLWTHPVRARESMNIWMYICSSYLFFSLAMIQVNFVWIESRAEWITFLMSINNAFSFTHPPNSNSAAPLWRMCLHLRVARNFRTIFIIRRWLEMNECRPFLLFVKYCERVCIIDELPTHCEMSFNCTVYAYWRCSFIYRWLYLRGVCCEFEFLCLEN